MPASLLTEIGRSKLKIWAKKANAVASACLYKLGPSSMLQAMEYNDMGYLEPQRELTPRRWILNSRSDVAQPLPTSFLDK
jgi:hypothetical protein